MKWMIPITVFVLSTCQSARAQLVLNAGDTYSNTFSSLPFLGSLAPVPAGTPNSFSASFLLDVASIQPGDSFSFELVVDGGGSQTLVWQDAASPQSLSLPTTSFGGLVRFTGLSGSVTVDSIRMDCALHGSTFVPSLNFYGATIVPVPEPGTAALWAVGVVGIWFIHRKGARSKPGHAAS